MFVFSLAPADSMRESYLQKILRTGMLAAAMIRRALRSLKKGREAGGGRGCSATTLEVHTSGQVGGGLALPACAGSTSSMHQCNALAGV